MKRLTVMAPAKINLSLDIVGRRSDGYHLLSTVMQSVDLADLVILQLILTGTGPAVITLTCDQPNIPADRRNTAWKAAELFFAHEALKSLADSGIRLSIHLKKNIPAAAGLAGGSADAAAVLFGLNRFYPDRLNRVDIAELAVRTGADVPFCLSGGTVLCEGIGDILTPLTTWADLPVLLICPGQPLLTARVFAAWQASGQATRPDQEAVLKAIRNHDLAALAASSANVLETVSFDLLPELALIRRRLLASGAVMAQMSGSGPTVFGLYASRDAMEQACAELREDLPAARLIPCSSIASGPRLLEP